MSDQTIPATLEPRGLLVNITHAIYGLHAISIAIGIIGAATIVGSFISSIPSIIAVVLNYLRRNETRGTYLESHFRWQIRTFWFSWLWVAIGVVLFFTIILAPVAIGIFVALTLWVIYRVARGWLRLKEKQQMYL